MSSSKAQAIIEQISEMDSKAASPWEGYRKMEKVLKLKSCNGCPYLKLRTHPGATDIVAMYTCEGSHAKTVVTKFVMTGTKSDTCPFEKLHKMMNEAHKEIRREVSQAVTGYKPQEPKP